jgi:hypothetical protein
MAALAQQAIYGAGFPVRQALALMTGAGGPAIAADGLPGGAIATSAVLPL